MDGEGYGHKERNPRRRSPPPLPRGNLAKRGIGWRTDTGDNWHEKRLGNPFDEKSAITEQKAERVTSR